jgi:hypothetical protein
VFYAATPRKTPQKTTYPELTVIKKGGNNPPFYVYALEEVIEKVSEVALAFLHRNASFLFAC